MKTFSTLLFLVNVGWLGGSLSLSIKKTSDKQNQVNNSLKVI